MDASQHPNICSLVLRRDPQKWSALISFMHVEHTEWERRSGLCCMRGLRTFSGNFHTILHSENWSELNCSWHYFALTMATELCEGQNYKLFTATFQAGRGDFLILKRPSQQKQKYHFNNSLSGVVFTLVWLVWRHFFLTDVFTSSSFLPLSLCLLPRCGNECQTNNVSYLEARTRQELIVRSELKYHVVWRGI